MHAEVIDWVNRWATDDRIRVVEIGAQDMNGSTRPLFPNADYWGIDIAEGEGVDEVADGARWLPAEPVDLVVCCEVLEHAPGWEAIVLNSYEMLRPGGRVVITAAGPGRHPHSGRSATLTLEPDEHYENIDPARLRQVLGIAGYTDIVIHILGADVRATGVKE